jgi:hypothetical protein
MAPPVCPANAHEESLYFVISFFYRGYRKKLLLRVVRNLWRRCSRLTFFNEKNVLSSSAGKALVDLQEKESINERRKSRLSSMSMIRIV